MEYLNDDLQVFARILVALVCGLAVGLERHLKHKPAGMGTYSLVAVSTALFTYLGLEITRTYEAASPEIDTMIDSSRIINAVAVGVSFLGAGTIIKQENEHHVENLGTAAALLVMGGVGIAAALEHYALALFVSALTCSKRQSDRPIKLLQSR